MKKKLKSRPKKKKPYGTFTQNQPSTRFEVIRAFVKLRSTPGPTPSPPNVLKEARERSFFTLLLQGMVRYDLLLESELKNRIKKHQKLQHSLRSIVKLGLYELLFMEKIPAHASIHQAGWLADQFKVSASKPLINGVLRHLQRELDNGYDTKQNHSFELGESIPSWMFERWTRFYGEEQAKMLCKASNCFIGLHVCATSSELLDAVVKEFTIKEIPFTHHSKIKDLLHIGEGARLWETEAFRQGWINVIDPSNMSFLNWARSWFHGKMLDVCAAPGGKSMQLDGFQEVAFLVINDLSRPRIMRLKENFSRIHDSNSLILQADGQKLPFKDNFFDAVLLDVPCSSTGTLHKNPDIKWVDSEKNLLRHQILQKNLLNEGARVLHPKGVMVYATCSLEPEENELQVKEFLEKHPTFSLNSTSKKNPYELSIEVLIEEKKFKLLPDGSQGGFFAVAFSK